MLEIILNQEDIFRYGYLPTHKAMKRIPVIRKINFDNAPALPSEFITYVYLFQTLPLPESRLLPKIVVLEAGHRLDWLKSLETESNDLLKGLWLIIRQNEDIYKAWRILVAITHILADVDFNPSSEPDDSENYDSSHTPPRKIRIEEQASLTPTANLKQKHDKTALR